MGGYTMSSKNSNSQNVSDPPTDPEIMDEASSSSDHDEAFWAQDRYSLLLPLYRRMHPWAPYLPLSPNNLHPLENVKWQGKEKMIVKDEGKDRAQKKNARDEDIMGD
ncbi:hypothetical protein Fot_38618 [Forsythia ovata]|uniref:Uncharacterized protein n=1 Tax=Forsythia ovata TaxID=205694 RepID=A0ABD1S2C4_9LAMI